VLIICGSRNACQWNRSGLWSNDSGSTGLTNRSATANVEGYQIGDCVEGLVFELILRSFINRVGLNYNLLGKIRSFLNLLNLHKIELRF